MEAVPSQHGPPIFTIRVWRFRDMSVPCRLAVRFVRSLQSMASRLETRIGHCPLKREQSSERGACPVRIPRRHFSDNEQRVGWPEPIRQSRPIVSDGFFRGRTPPFALKGWFGRMRSATVRIPFRMSGRSQPSSCRLFAAGRRSQRTDSFTPSAGREPRSHRPTRGRGGRCRSFRRSGRSGRGRRSPAGWLSRPRRPDPRSSCRAG